MNRRFLRYSLRALLLLVLLAAIPMAWLAKVQRGYEAERQAIEMLWAHDIVALPQGEILQFRTGAIWMAPTSWQILPSPSRTFDAPTRSAKVKNYQNFLASGWRWTTATENWRARSARIVDGWLFSPGDEIIPHLAQLRDLESIEIWGTGITEEGIRELRRALPDCEIDWQPDYGRLAETE